MKKMNFLVWASMMWMSSYSMAASAKRAPLEFKLHHQTVLSVTAVENVQMRVQPEEKNWAVSFKLNDTDAKAFEKITAENNKETLEVFLDGKVVMAPRINTVIPNGLVVLTSPTEKKANELYRRLVKIHS